MTADELDRALPRAHRVVQEAAVRRVRRRAAAPAASPSTTTRSTRASAAAATPAARPDRSERRRSTSIGLTRREDFGTVGADRARRPGAARWPVVDLDRDDHARLEHDVVVERFDAAADAVRDRRRRRLRSPATAGRDARRPIRRGSASSPRAVAYGRATPPSRRGARRRAARRGPRSDRQSGRPTTTTWTVAASVVAIASNAGVVTPCGRGRATNRPAQLRRGHAASSPRGHLARRRRAATAAAARSASISSGVFTRSSARSIGRRVDERRASGTTDREQRARGRGHAVDADARRASARPGIAREQSAPRCAGFHVSRRHGAPPRSRARRRSRRERAGCPASQSRVSPVTART